MSTPRHGVRWTAQARDMLTAIQDQRVRGKIIDRVKQLEADPDKQGKALVGELAGYRCVRAVGQRYRVIYTIEREHVLVLVVAIGIRKDRSPKDFYALARRLLSLRLVEPPE